MSSPKPVPPPLDEPIDPAPKATRRTFTTEYRNRIIDEYRAAPFGEKSAVLRREGLYQSQLREWSATRENTTPKDAVHRGKSKTGNTIDASGRKEIDRLNRRNVQLEKQLTQTEAALEIMGKLHVLLESISESTGTTMPPTTHSTPPSTNSAPPRSRRERRAH
jgi:transposase